MFPSWGWGGGGRHTGHLDEARVEVLKFIISFIPFGSQVWDAVALVHPASTSEERAEAAFNLATAGPVGFGQKALEVPFDTHRRRRR